MTEDMPAMALIGACVLTEVHVLMDSFCDHADKISKRVVDLVEGCNRRTSDIKIIELENRVTC